MAAPRSASYEATIESILRGLANLPAIFNPQRRLSAYDAAAALEREGLTEGTTVAQAANDQAGNVTYRLVRGLDGRLYRQRFRQTNNAMAASGTLQSSFTGRQLKDEKRELDTAANAAISGFERGQAESFAKQSEAWRGGAEGLGETRGAYADWQAQQPVAIATPPEPTLATPQPSIGAPHAGSGVGSKPRLIRLSPEQADNPYERNNLIRSNPGYDLKRRGGNLGYVLKRRR